MSKKKGIMLCLCMLLFVLCTIRLTVYAETKQTEIASLNRQADLTVMFTFDREIVDINFISPTGEVISSDSDDVEFAQGNLWCTYRIINAEPGVWSVEYDLKSNSEIDYSVIEDDYGLWIQYLDLKKNDGKKIELAFEADFDEEDIYYSYELYAISLADASATNKLSSGTTRANEEKKISVSLSQLPSDEYVIKLEVFYDDDGVEVFDSVLSEPIQYVNANELSSIEDYIVKINLYDHICLIDWSDYVNWGYDGYKLIVTADGEAIYNAEMESDVQSNSILFSEGTQNLEVRLAYKDYDTWSQYNIKTIDLGWEYLTNATGTVTNSSQIEVQYKTIRERPLNVRINSEEGEYRVNQSGMLSFDLKDGSNEVYAELELDDRIYFVVDATVYSDRKPPSITLYDNLDGKTFFTDSATVLGKISGGKILKINRNEIALNADGSFEYEVNLSLGENIIEILCEDANGNESSRILTLYRSASVLNANGILSYLPLVASLLTSTLIIILAVVYMRKKNKSAKKTYKVAPFVVCDIVIALFDILCWWQFIARYSFGNSIEYLEMAEKSASQAVRYIKTEKTYGITAVVAFVVLVLSIVMTYLVAKKNRTKAGE